MIHWLTQHKFIFGTLLLFVVTFFLGVWLLNGTTFADPDSFYHIKIAERIADAEGISEFPWLPFTVLNEYYADQHFLYHVFLAPFVKFLGAFEGAKLATIFLAASFVVVFTLTLRACKVRGALIYGFILLTLTPFIFRLYLVKAPAFSLLLLFAGIAFAWRKKWIAVSVLSFIYAWSYGGFVLLPLVIIWLTVARLASRFITEKRYLARKKPEVQIIWKRFLHSLVDRGEIRVLLASFFGMIVGIFTHPFFPNIIKYVNDQLIQIGIVNYRDVIGVGNEWYPFDFSQLVTNNILLSIGILLTILGALFYGKKLSARTLFLFPLFIGGLVFTLKSSRYIEYYVPFSLFFVASAFSDYVSGITYKKIMFLIRQVTAWQWAAWGVFGLFIIASLVYVVPRDMRSIRTDLQGGVTYYHAKDVSHWLAEHSNKGDVVIHSDWDDFPYLFYWNDVNYYIVGLDPTFLYRANKDRYWAWVNLTIGKTTDDLAGIARTQFNARYILIEKDHTEFLRNARREKDFIQVYEDTKYVVFEVLERE